MIDEQFEKALAAFDEGVTRVNPLFAATNPLATTHDNSLTDDDDDDDDHDSDDANMSRKPALLDDGYIGVSDSGSPTKSSQFGVSDSSLEGFGEENSVMISQVEEQPEYLTPGVNINAQGMYSCPTRACVRVRVYGSYQVLCVYRCACVCVI